MRRRDLFAALLASLILAVPARALKTESYSVPGGHGPAGAPLTLTVTTGQALLRLSSGTASASLTAPLAAAGARLLSDLGGGWVLVGWDGAPVSAKLPSLAALPGVAAAEPSWVHGVSRFPDDPLATAQYALAKTDAFRAWELETGLTSRVTVAVVDTGISGTHPDLSPKLANTTSVAYDPNTGAVASPNDPLTPACEHGTEVAGVAAAATNNGYDVAGVSWGAQLVSYKVFLDADCNADCSDKGGNLCETNDPAIISAINQAISVQNSASHGRMVVNMSLGGAGSCGAALQTAINNAVAANVVVVAAAGNDSSSVNNPGNCAGVIPVGATDMNDSVAYFSSNGAPLANFGLVAPGVSLTTTQPGNTTTSNATGTSFSSPMVSGAAALVLAAKPALTQAQVQTLLREGVDRLPGVSSAMQGAGRLNLYNLMQWTINGSTPTTNGVNADAKPFAFPNPFRLSQGSGVQFSIPPSLGRSGLDIKVYTLDGLVVRELNADVWDGKNKDGNLVASGSYVFVVKTANGSARGRLAVLR